jgi:AAA family ATP:ADP antiporter
VSSLIPAALRKDAAATMATLAFFFVLTSYYIVRPVRDQLGGAVGSSQLPLFYAVTFVVMLLLMPVFGTLVARFQRRRLLGWSYSFFVACLLAFIPVFMAQDRLGARAIGSVFYVWVSVFNLFVVSLFWSFMADVFRERRAREIFPVIAVGGSAGAIFGPMLTSALVNMVGVAPLLFVSAVMLTIALFLLLRISVRQCAQHEDAEAPIGGSPWAGAKEFFSRPFLRYMTILMLLGDGVGTLAYALTADYVKAHIATAAARTDFYTHIDWAANTLVVILQLSLSRQLLVRRGAMWALVAPQIVNALLLAMVMIGGHAELRFLGYGVPLLAVLMVGTRGFMYGMTAPASNSLYTRVPRETRYKGKNFVETLVWRFGDLVVTSGVSGLSKLGAGLSTFTLIGVGASAIAAWTARKAATSPDLAPEERATLPQALDGQASP